MSLFDKTNPHFATSNMASKKLQGSSPNFASNIDSFMTEVPILLWMVFIFGLLPEADSGLVKLVVTTNIFFNNQQHKNNMR